VDIIKLLKEKGATLNSVDAKRRSPLYLAALYKQNDAFDFLVSQGGRVAQQALGGMTISMVAAFSGNMHILKAAIEGGVRLDAVDQKGKTALEFAKQGNHPEAIAYLEEQDALAKAAATKKPAKKEVKAATPAPAATNQKAQ
jgi:ankyrin repeat protein